jgi:hypothetical protein
MSGEGKRSHWPTLNAAAPFLDAPITRADEAVLTERRLNKNTAQRSSSGKASWNSASDDANVSRCLSSRTEGLREAMGKWDEGQAVYRKSRIRVDEATELVILPE